MLLVIDITKGIQTQTAECLIIGEITCDKMLVVLNKIDLIEENQRQLTIDKVEKKRIFRSYFTTDLS
jgi:selenocysteine-specific elongation factor